MIRSRPVLLTLVVAFLLAAVAPAMTAAQARRPAVVLPTVPRSAVTRAVDYLRARQMASGGFEGFTPGQADEFTTIKVVLAVAAANRPQSALTASGGATALDYLATRAVAYTHAGAGSGPLFPGRAGQLMAAAVAGNADPTAFGGMNLVAELQATYSPTTGAYSTSAREGFSSGEANAINQLWSILGLAAALQPIPGRATDFLLGLQETDGGWGFGAGGDIDTTALVLQALIASGNVAPDSPKVAQGLAFLRANQAETGGWAAFGSLSADSTAVAVQGIAAAGFVPSGPSWLSTQGRTPLDDLASLQAADGSFGGNALGTADALPGLTEAPLPIYGRGQRARLAATWLASQQNADGSFAGFSGPDVGATADATIAFAAARIDPGTVRTTAGGGSPIDYLAANGATYAGKSPDAAGKLIVAVAAAGRDPRAFGGADLVQLLNSQYNPSQGAFGDRGNTWYQSFALLGLVAAGQAVPPAAVQTLIGLQQPDGGWKYDLSPGDFNTTGVDNTGLALQALAAAGVPSSSASVQLGRSFLRARQDAAGGWGNANSTALAIQGLASVGETLATGWTTEGQTPYEALAAFQKRDGPLVYDRSVATDNQLATSQAIPALLGQALPIQLARPTPALALAPFSPVVRPPDPDRLVAGPPRGILAPGGVDVLVPAGSDQNGNARATFSWRVDGGGYQTLALQRASGYFTGTIPSRRPGRYDLRVVVEDPDGVQGAAEQTASIAVPPFSVRLPAVPRRAVATP